MVLTFKKTFFTTVLTLLVSYFFLELFNFKEKIMTIQKNQVSITSQIVILTGGTNRIKKGFEIINKFDEKSKKNIKILVSGTGKGFTKLSLQKKLNSNLYLKLIECCVELDGVSKDTYSNANETSKWVNKISFILFLFTHFEVSLALE